MITELKNRWNALPLRTRRLILAGTVAIAATLLYAVAWLPLERDLVRLRTGVPLEAEQLNWMRVQAPVAKAMRAKTTGTAGAPIPGIEQSALTHGMRSYITRLEAEGSAGARVTLEAVPFNALIAWISELQAAQGLIVEETTINAHATPGVVNAQLRFRSGA
jgi:general secretion pathway protein M